MPVMRRGTLWMALRAAIPASAAAMAAFIRARCARTRRCKSFIAARSGLQAFLLPSGAPGFALLRPGKPGDVGFSAT
jgi:hypothetical protein